jgi:hypothetical protein
MSLDPQDTEMASPEVPSEPQDGGVAVAERRQRAAPRAILVPIGAALTARAEMAEILAALTSPEQAVARVRQFEERGLAAQERVEAELHRRRAQAAKDLAARAEQIGSQLRDIAVDLASKVNEVASMIGDQMPTHSS